MIDMYLKSFKIDNKKKKNYLAYFFFLKSIVLVSDHNQISIIGCA